MKLGFKLDPFSLFSCKEGETLVRQDREAEVAQKRKKLMRRLWKRLGRWKNDFRSSFRVHAKLFQPFSYFDAVLCFSIARLCRQFLL
jgi:hypothetical protein